MQVSYISKSTEASNQLFLFSLFFIGPIVLINLIANITDRNQPFGNRLWLLNEVPKSLWNMLS